MSKTITLNLTEAEYNYLLQNYLLGTLIESEVNQHTMYSEQIRVVHRRD